MKAAGLSVDSWHSIAIKEIKSFFKNPIYDRLVFNDLREKADRYKAFEPIQNVPDLCKSLYKLQFGKDFTGDIRKLRSKYGERTGFSFSVAMEPDPASEDSEHEDFHMSIKWWWHPAEENSIFISKRENDWFILFPYIYGESFVLNENQLNSEIYENIIKIYSFQLSMYRLQRIRINYFFGKGLFYSIRRILYFPMKEFIISYFNNEDSKFREIIVTSYVDIIRLITKNLTSNDISELHSTDSEFLYNNLKYLFVSDNDPLGVRR